MPEGDTIFRVATALRAALAGRAVERFEAPRLGASVEPGTTVRSVESRGKHLLVAFGDGRVLHTHLQMTGAWHVYRPGEPWRRPAYQLRALVAVADAEAVCFRAPVVELLAERDLARHPVLSALGPDLCSPAVDVDEVLMRLDRLAPDTAIGVALLDQRVASGIGNVYKSEVLFARRVDPFARLDALDGPARRRLYETASELLRRNLDGGPRATVPGGLAVYGKARRPCPRCGAPIASRRQGESARVTYWCPSCQPAPAAAAR